MVMVANHAENVWIHRYHPTAEANTQLVCFPHAGGSASYYFALSRSLAPGIETLAVQYPGRQDRYREKCIENISELADQVFAALSGWIDRPVAFFGHSMGATLAFEVGRRLQRHDDQALVHLFASGRQAPSRHRHEDIHLRDDAGLVAELRRIGGTDQRFLDDGELRDFALPMIRSDYKAIETYHYASGPSLDCPITALLGDSDPTVTIDEVAAWAEHCTGPFYLRIFPGGHFYLAENHADVIRTISGSLPDQPSLG